MTKKKISLIGGGNIGGTLAHLIGLKRLGDVVVLDIAEGIPQGKALDLAQSSSIENFDCTINGTNNYADIADSDVVIVTAGLPRKPGMSRDDLLEINGKIIQTVGKNIKKFSPNAFVIVVTNPLDAMVYVMKRATGFSPNKVVGMAGMLDAARFQYFLSQALNISPRDINTLVLGGHGDTMVPLERFSNVGGINLIDIVRMGLLSRDSLNKIIQRTRDGGGEIVSLLKSGSAFYSPASAIITMIEAYLYDTKRILPCAAWLQGEYGEKNIYVGVPTIIGSGGVENIIQLDLLPNEFEMLKKSINSVKSLIDSLHKLLDI